MIYMINFQQNKFAPYIWKTFSTKEIHMIYMINFQQTNLNKTSDKTCHKTSDNTFAARLQKLKQSKQSTMRPWY